MLVTILVVLNIPVYVFIGWLAFDNKDNAADTFFETIAAVLKMILVPRPVRTLLGMDASGSFGLFPLAGVLRACAGVVYGEYPLIAKLFALG